jgi:hypothetical protein
MHPDVEAAFDQIDAALFSGDTFWNKDNMHMLEVYLRRWYAKMVETKQIIIAVDHDKS